MADREVEAFDRRLLDVLLEEVSLEERRGVGAQDVDVDALDGWPPEAAPGPRVDRRAPARTTRLAAAALFAIAAVFAVALQRPDAAPAQDPEPAEVLSVESRAAFDRYLSQAVELRLVRKGTIGAGAVIDDDGMRVDRLDTVRWPGAYRVRGEQLAKWRAALAASPLASEPGNTVHDVHDFELWLEGRRVVRCFASLGGGASELWVGEDEPIAAGDDLETLLEAARLEIERRRRLERGRVLLPAEFALLPRPTRRLDLEVAMFADPVWEERAGEVEELVVRGELRAGGWRRLRALPSLRSLELVDVTLDDAALDELTGLAALRSLVLRRCGELSKDRTARIAKLVGLERLHCIDTRVGGPDTDLSVLASLPRLREFGWCVADAELPRATLEVLLRTKLDRLLLVDVLEGTDLSVVGQLPSLRELVVVGRIGDQDLEQLHELRSLRLLVLRNASTSPAAVAALRERLPDCRIDWREDQRWFDRRYAFEYMAARDGR